VYGFVAKGGITPPQGMPTQIMRGGSREARDKMAVAVDSDTDKQLLTQAIAEHKDNIETAGYTPYTDSVAENFGNPWWRKSSPHSYERTINRSGIAVYAAANWDEGATGYGAPFIYNNLKNPKKLILGPATHCDWTSVLKDTGFDIIVEELRFFDHWLKGIDNSVMREHAVTYYTYNEAPGKEWKTSATWPLRNEKRTPFYLSAGSLGKTKSSATGSSAKTVNYAVSDATFWKDGMTFVTEPLAVDTEVTGHSVLNLWLQTTANDADVIARIDDVAPGTQRYVSIEGRQRASLRATAKAPYNNLGLPWHPFTQTSLQPLVPGKSVQVSFDLFATSYVFKAGHRIRLTLQFADSRSTPKLDPAPTVTVLHNKEMPSALVLPIIPR
jgi:predicted acyl esterase